MKKNIYLWIHMAAENTWMNFECSAGLLIGKYSNRNVGNFALIGHRKINAAINIIILYLEEMGRGCHMALVDGFQLARFLVPTRYENEWLSSTIICIIKWLKSSREAGLKDDGIIERKKLHLWVTDSTSLAYTPTARHEFL